LRKSLLFAAIFMGNANAGHIYLLRGLAGIFSTGLDILDQKLIQRGFTATVHGHLDYEELASEAARLQKSGKGPIIIMGHSLGADAAIFMADKMKSLGAPVALVVTFGPTMNLVAPSNISQVINYYTGNTVVAKGPGASGARFPMWISMEPPPCQRYLKSSDNHWPRTCRTHHETRPSKLGCCRTMNTRG
jgi:fermentation-respiration switch protein FrsA (DUF1100 family)